MPEFKRSVTSAFSVFSPRESMPPKKMKTDDLPPLKSSSEVELHIIHEQQELSRMNISLEKLKVDVYTQYNAKITELISNQKKLGSRGWTKERLTDQIDKITEYSMRTLGNCCHGFLEKSAAWHNVEDVKRIVQRSFNDYTLLYDMFKFNYEQELDRLMPEPKTGGGFFSNDVIKSPRGLRADNTTYLPFDVRCCNV